MDQLNKIKLEDDPMAHSWENDKMVITHIQHFNKRIEIKLMEIKSKKEHILSLFFIRSKSHTASP